MAFSDPDVADSAKRELEEEMGITGVPLRHVFDGPYQDSVTRLWGSVFVCTYTGPVVPQESEVADVVMLNHQAVAALTPSQATPDSLHFYRVWQQLEGSGSETVAVTGQRQWRRMVTLGLGAVAALALVTLGYKR